MIRINSKQEIYYQFLDCLRGIAITMVVIHHICFHFMPLVNDYIARFLMRVGWSGVDVFFAISGFLITKILLKTNEIRDIKAFYIKRAFRIIPLYFSCIILYLIFGFIVGEKNISMLWVNAFFLTGWFIPFFSFDAIPYEITWSLSVEEFAYIFFGFISLLDRKKFTAILITVIVFSLVLRWILIDIHIFQLQEVYYFPLTRIDSIAFGGLVALDFIQRKKSKIFIVITIIFSCLLYILLCEFGQYNRTVAIFGYSLIPFSSALIVSIAVSLKETKNFFIKIITHIGKRSYFIYLFHVFVIGLVELPFFENIRVLLGVWGITASIILITLVMAEISWFFFELPLIQKGRKIAYYFK